MMEQMTITLRTKSPVVLSAPGNTNLLTSTRDVFAGSVLRGLVAARYIEKRGSDGPVHEDAAFRRLFFGGVRFVDAYPKTQAGVAFPLPASLQKSKDGSKIMDLFNEDAKKGFKAFRGLGVEIGDALAVVQTKKTMTLHMSRCGEDSENKGFNTERLSGKSEEGHIFTYEALCEEQEFEGLLVGEKEDLDELRRVIGNRWRGRAGRSKYVEYGEVDCTLGETDIALPAPPPVPADGEARLFLRTPLLPLSGDASSAWRVLQEAVAEEMNSRRGTKAFKIGKKIFANAEASDSFVGVWRLRRPRQTALSAGSCFTLEKDGAAWDEADMAALCDLMYEGAGLRPEEGFGQLRIWEKQEWRPASEEDKRKIAAAQQTVEIQSASVREKAANILRVKRLADIREWAGTVAKSSSASLRSHPAHVFTRLDGLLSSSKTAGEFQTRIKAATEDQSTAFCGHLNKIKITLSGDKKESLYSLLTDDLTRPYKGRLKAVEDVMGEAYRTIGESGVLSAEDDVVFREYWHWFFRYARKESRMEAGK